MAGEYFVLIWCATGATIGAVASGAIRKLLTSPGGVLATRTTGALLTAILYGYLASFSHNELDLVIYSSLAAVAVPLAIVDTLEQRLPNTLLIPSTVSLAVMLSIAAGLHATWPDLTRALAGMAALSAFYLLLAVLSNGGLGAGDVKLGALLGLALTSQSWPTLLAGTLAGWLLAALTRVGLRLTGHTTRGTTMPLGPFLLLGALVVGGAMAGR